MPTNADLVAQVQQARRRLTEAGPPHERRAGDFERVALPHEDGDALRDVLVGSAVHTIVEVGLAYGSSALAIAEALAAHGNDGVRHIIIDAHQHHFRDAGWDALLAAGLGDRCTLLRERSDLALPRLLAEGFTGDAAFIDGSHVFHDVFVDLHFLRQIVEPGGLIVVDDCDWPSVATAVRYFERNTGWSEAPLGRPSRLRAFRLPDTPVEPSFEDFQPFA